MTSFLTSSDFIAPGLRFDDFLNEYPDDLDIEAYDNVDSLEDRDSYDSMDIQEEDIEKSRIENVYADKLTGETDRDLTQFGYDYFEAETTLSPGRRPA